MEQGSPSVPLLPERQITAQRGVERLIGDKQLIVHARSARARAQPVDVAIDLGSIRRLGVFGNDFDLLLGLEVDKDGGTFQYRTDLLGVEDVEEHDLVSAKAKRFNGAHNGLRVFVKIGDDNGDAATVE